jgi:membrane-associated phospholipid phosphatase
VTRPGTVRWLAGLAALIGLTLLVVAGASLDLDDRTLGWFTRLDRPGAVHGIWRTLVMGGQFWLVGTAAVVIAAIRAVQWRSLRTFAVSAVAVASVDVLLLVSKPLIGRTSPHSGRNEVLVGGSSYPSGHTSNATMCLALIAVLLAGTSIYRRRALFVAGLCAAVVGICNLVLGYHWLSEVVAGWVLGTLVVTAAAALLPRNSAQTPKVPAQAQVER